MNSLSWAIYAIQVSENLRAVATGVAAMTATILLAGLFVLVLPTLLGDDRERGIATGIRKGLLKTLVPTLLVALPFAVFTPSRQTLVLIVGSEIGQRAAQSEGVQAVIDPGLELLKTWLKAEKERLLKEALKTKDE